MADPAVKVRLRKGDCEIELEGPRGDVDGLLEQWWPGLASAKPPKTSTPPKPKTSSKAKGRRQARQKQADEEDAFDHVATANLLKESKHYDKITKKVLHETDNWGKAALVLWFANASLTSGDIRGTLSALDVRAALSTVSNVLKRHSDKLTQSESRVSGAKVRYKLTGKSRADFEKWLLQDDK